MGEWRSGCSLLATASGNLDRWLDTDTAALLLTDSPAQVVVETGGRPSG
jgi:hypothetical protein